MARNTAVLNRLHPGYAQLVADFVAADPLAGARRKLDLLRWRRARRSGGRAAVLITHDAGGGVERSVAAQSAALRAEGRRPIILRPAAKGGAKAVAVADDGTDPFPNLCFAMPGEFPALLRFLKAERPARMVLHHLLGHDPALLGLCEKLGLPYNVHVHDYGLFCPRISLAGAMRRYCGEPEAAHCEACIADAGRVLEEDIPVAALRRRSAALLRGAHRVVAPSADCAARITRHFPSVRPEVIPPEDDRPIPGSPRALRMPNRRFRVCVVGGIGVEKGYEVLLACARDAASRGLPLEFVVVGSTTDDARLLSTGRVFITGPYEAEEASALIRAQDADLGFLPSIVPETWCFTLSEMWEAGLHVLSFDIGAQAERMAKRGHGLMLPLRLPINVINNAILAAARRIRHECPAQTEAARLPFGSRAPNPDPAAEREILHV